MRNLLKSATLLAILAVFACKESPQTKANEVADKVAKAAEKITPKDPPQNILSDDELKTGVKLLFDGKSFNGWHNFGKATIGPDWIIDEAEQAMHLNVKQKQDGKWYADGGDIMTNDSYENFELQLEWKIDTCGNSGIIYNILNDTSLQFVWRSGPEMQVLDNACHPDAKIVKHRAGDLYDLIVSSKETVTPALQWNKVKIVQNKGKVEHWLNGEKVVEYDMNSPTWATLIKGSKFKDMPKFGKQKKGHIALQDHGNKVWYRNIKIKTL